jgi:prepilin-type N-terminal cleavage/methylation domain-containing protein
METKYMHKSQFPRKSQAGMTLIELMIAIMILAIGMGALTNLLVVAMATDNRNAKDTSATLLAQMVVEQISASTPIPVPRSPLPIAPGTPGRLPLPEELHQMEPAQTWLPRRQRSTTEGLIKPRPMPTSPPITP